MNPVKSWKRMFNTVESTHPKSAQLTESIEDIDIKITESPLQESRDFKAMTLNGLTLCYNADEVHIIHNPGLTYVSAIGKLIVLYDRKEDLDGFWFAAESIQKIKMNNRIEALEAVVG